MDQSLPHLGFREGEFDIALWSHFLFTYSERLSVDFHVAAIEEMCRVAAEACLPAAEKLRRTFSAPGASGGHFAGSRLPG